MTANRHEPRIGASGKKASARRPFSYPANDRATQIGRYLVSEVWYSMDVV